ncbi:MAG: hypothetical protein JNL18_01155 [Planctomycetaceae bacterium]|nr:hypothetical protein [Planctomycetaceae bacterium]
MMIAMTAFAVVVAVSSFLGIEPILTLIVGFALLFLLPVALATLAFYSRGPRRTFFAGAFVGSLSAHYMLRMFSMSSSALQVAILGTLLAIAVALCGATALLARRFAERRRWHLPSSDDAG